MFTNLVRHVIRTDTYGTIKYQNSKNMMVLVFLRHSRDYSVPSVCQEGSSSGTEVGSIQLQVFYI